MKVISISIRDDLCFNYKIRSRLNDYTKLEFFFFEIIIVKARFTKKIFEKILWKRKESCSFIICNRKVFTDCEDFVNWTKI